MFFKLAIKSLLSRKGSVVLTLMAMTVSIIVLLGVDHIRHQAKQSFASTVSGVDLIVGARTGGINLLLYSVFRVGAPTNNISWSSYQDIKSNPNVAWTIPISLGDSHKGFRVMGTTTDYFDHFSYGTQQKLSLKQGVAFSDIFDVVLGSDVAKKLNYKVGDKLVLSHGVTEVSFSKHDDKPFKVVGILAATGTPVDQTLHVSLEGIEAIHVDWQQGVKTNKTTSIEQLQNIDLTPKSITAFMVGLKSRIATFALQRQINTYKAEPIMAVLPGVELSQLWQMMSMLENTLQLISIFVLVAALLGLSAMLLASIREREHEIYLLRIMGASPLFLFILIQSEALLITLSSILLAALILFVSLVPAGELLSAQFGLHITNNFVNEESLWKLLSILVATAIVAVIPSISIYKKAKR